MSTQHTETLSIQVDEWEGVGYQLRSLERQRDQLLAALQATLPALIRLGDFIGNVDNADVHPRGTGIDRCKLIEQVRAAIAAATGEA